MNAVKVFTRTHPVVTYFALTFAISWGGALAVIGRSGGSGAITGRLPRRLAGFEFRRS